MLTTSGLSPTGGTDELDNLATLCEDCNRGKGAHVFQNYRELREAVSQPQDRKYIHWLALKGKQFRLEPLIGHPGWELPDTNFRVEDITATDLRLYKTSCQQGIILPMSCISDPWGSEQSGGPRAVIERGTLRYYVEKRGWEWRP
jgi:HNH endonuclease